MIVSYQNAECTHDTLPTDATNLSGTESGICTELLMTRDCGGFAVFMTETVLDIR
jgi:hypothetical protein